MITRWIKEPNGTIVKSSGANVTKANSNPLSQSSFAQEKPKQAKLNVVAKKVKQKSPKPVFNQWKFCSDLVVLAYVKQSEVNSAQVNKTTS